jgi:hypothetical protein
MDREALDVVLEEEPCERVWERLPVARPQDWLGREECPELSDAQRQELRAALAAVGKALAHELLLSEPLDVREVRQVVEGAGLDYARVRAAALRVLRWGYANARESPS